MRNISIITTALTLIAACDPDPAEFDGVTPDDTVVPLGKADGPEVTVQARAAYDLVRMGGTAALELYAAMDRAGGLYRTRRGALHYVYGRYSLCVSNGSAAACELYAEDSTLGQGGYVATFHGERFASAASEVFGVLARAQGISPASVTEVNLGRFVCGKTSAEVWCGITDASQTSTLDLSLHGLEPLGPDYVYEGWLITAAGPVSTGRFDLDGTTATVTMEVPAETTADAELFVLTIEPRVGDDPAPAQTHVLAGPFVSGIAELGTAHGAALGSDFVEANGGFILGTPSTAGISDDYAQGVWFIDPAAGPGPSLDLPTLPAGWAYEGWVAGPDGPISTGRFTELAAADDDAGGPTAGPDATPPFPGQDFINPPRLLTQGYSVVVSVEPEPDNSPLPFALKPLAGPVDDAGGGVLQALDNIAEDTALSGRAVLR